MTTRTPIFGFTRRNSVPWISQALLCVVALALLPAAKGSAQNPPLQPHVMMLQQPIGQHAGGMDGLPGTDPIQNEKLFRALNADRQKSLVSDTNKLLRLVNELNDEIARTNPNALTEAQLRKVAEIEKLARNVKDKMSTSVGGTPAFLPPLAPVHN
jgi:hypothetical protein